MQNKFSNLLRCAEIYLWETLYCDSPTKPSLRVYYIWIHNFIDVILIESLKANNINVAKSALKVLTLDKGKKQTKVVILKEQVKAKVKALVPLTLKIKFQ